MAVLKKILGWISNHTKLILLALVVIVFTILIFWWGRKNQRIRSLENQLAILKAKLKIETLQIKYETEQDKLKDLRAKDMQLNKELDTIEQSLTERLKEKMTAEEIAAKFKELGIR